MPYSTPEHNPAADYVAHFTGPGGVVIDLQILAQLPVGTETQRDDAMQNAIDALASLSGWDLSYASRIFSAYSVITETP